MDPVHKIVGEHQEEGYRDDEVRPSILGHIVVQFGIPHDLGLEPREGEQRHTGERFQTSNNLVSNLVF